MYRKLPFSLSIPFLMLHRRVGCSHLSALRLHIWAIVYINHSDLVGAIPGYSYHDLKNNNEYIKNLAKYKKVLVKMGLKSTLPFPPDCSTH